VLVEWWVGREFGWSFEVRQFLREDDEKSRANYDMRGVAFELTPAL
jgi:hypothetical protein